MTEWRALPGWEGHYEVSDEGQVRSVVRIIRQGRRVGGRILKLRPSWSTGYLTVDLILNGKRNSMTVHKAVMLTFVGPRPEKQDVRHLDGNPANNHLANLAYGTRSENNLDAVRHGTNSNTAKTHCLRGHEFNEGNTYINTVSLGRQCRECKKIHRRNYKERKAATRTVLDVA